jgi:hypothetical protein
MSYLAINNQGWKAVERSVATLLGQIAAIQVERLKDNLHEDTGRLAQTPRLAGEPEIANDRVTTTILIGGMEVPGVYKEVGIMGYVDYAVEEEVRHPQAHETIPEYADDIRAGFAV